MSHDTATRRFLSPASAMLVAALTAGAVFATAAGAHAAPAKADRAAAVAPVAPIAAGLSAQADDGSVPQEVAPELAGLTDEEFDQVSTAAFEPYLANLEAVPDEVLEQGGDAVVAYLQQQAAEAPQAPVAQFGPTNWLKCAGLVAAAAAGALIPASKVLKVAKIIKKYGVRRVINAIKGIRKGKGASLSGDLKEVSLILLGVEGIKSACS